MSKEVKLNAAQIDQWKKARESVKLGRRGDALLEFQKLLKLAPAHPHILFEAGRAANAANDLDLATRCLQKAAKVAGDDAKLLCSIGRLSMHLRLIDDGLQCFRRRRNFLSVKVFRMDLKADFKRLVFGGFGC
jgi:tetratricopeptide (TPR) repeat protein